MSLTQSLRIVAILLILAAAFQYYLHAQLLVKTIIAAHVILLLSFFSDNYKQRISVVSIGLAIVVPIGAGKQYYAGELSLSFLFFNLIVFTYLAFISIQTMMILKKNNK